MVDPNVCGDFYCGPNSKCVEGRNGPECECLVGYREDSMEEGCISEYTENVLINNVLLDRETNYCNKCLDY